MSDVERFRAAVDPYLDDFEDLLRVVELSSGFVLQPIAVPGPDLGRLLANWLSLKMHPTMVVEPEGADAWKSVASSLLNAKPEKNGVVLVLAGGDLPDDLSLALRLVNEQRDVIAKHLDCPLLWCGSSAFLVQTAQQAPDFWSVRAVERRIEARQKPQSKKLSPRKASAPDGLLDEALKQGDRKSSEILFLSHMRKAMAEGQDDDFDAVVPSIPAGLEQADRKFAFESGLMKAEMARRRGNIGDALKTLDALQEKIGNADEECRVNLLRGRVWERAGDSKQADKAYKHACRVAESKDPSLEPLAYLYHIALRARRDSVRWMPELMHWREHAQRKTGDQALVALATAFVAEAMARQHDLRRAQRLLSDAIASHETTKENATILFPGELAEAIQNVKAVIERAEESAPNVVKATKKLEQESTPRADINIVEVSPNKVGSRVVPDRSRPRIVTLVLVVLMCVAYTLLRTAHIESKSLPRDTMHCFQGKGGKISCAASLDQCEYLRATVGQERAGPCQKPLFTPSGD